MSKIKKEIITPFSHLENKTGKHKDWYTPELLSVLCDTLNDKKVQINKNEALRKFKQNFKKLELKDRLKLIADLFDQYVEGTYKQKLKKFETLLGPKWPYEEGLFEYAYHLYPISQYIEKYGVSDIETSFQFIEKITQRFTGEWAIRPLLNARPVQALKQMKEWSKHENFHVRRLASEGLRAKLPWGIKVGWVNEKPEKTLPIYNKLRNDSSLYVRRSVANSMGDMIKINSELAAETFERWLKQKQTKENLWVIKHAVRHPDKKGVKYYVELRKKVTQLMKNLKS